MEFVDRITPMEERYVEMPSAYDGNYAFIWDYLCRSIAHPRHHSIVGFNPETGEPEIPWLEDQIYNEWQTSRLPYTEFIKGVPVFNAQSRNKYPAPQLTAQGLVRLDGRYLNNAPQCTGWFDLTKEGGSGSFLILWSGIWKPNTAATIPYYTGNYGKTKRGFGFVAIGAGLEDFQRPALETEQKLLYIAGLANTDLNSTVTGTQNMISTNLVETTEMLGLSAGLMIILVVFIAVWMANIFTASITRLVKGIARFHSGERHFRFNAKVKDEIGILADSFDEMADSLVEVDRGPMVITGMDLRVIYANEAALSAMGYTLENTLKRHYFEMSVYPANSEYDPITALNKGREAHVLYLSDRHRFLRGEASYLTDRVGNKIGYIITSNDVTELMEQQKALESAMREAKLANVHKNVFLARMSHEIRTPLNAIIGMTGIVKKNLAGKNAAMDEVFNNIRQIEIASHHLLGLFNDILDISKIESGRIELAREEMDLDLLVYTVASIIQFRCNEGGIVFETYFDIPKKKAYIGDALRLRQVLLNLLGNAVKFTPRNGKIIFSVKRRGNIDGKAIIDFEILDTGIGISKDSMEHLFAPFQQVDNEIFVTYGGTGLGLAISRSIVQLFGGDINVISKEGEGSEFSFTLELEETDAKEDDEIHIEDITDRLIGKRALVVDDVEINNTVIINMLKSTGLEFDEAGNGATAVMSFSLSEDFYYDIIFMDIQMPVMTGYEAATVIRTLDRPDAKTVPIVALTALAFKEDIQKAFNSGMNSHVAKPIDAEKLIEVTFRLLEIER
jgi:signal transduction histidine kinase/CheY-like chemotaxis protein/HAMP domain-containing protein